MNQALAHLTVVELASVLAGPSVGMFFAELGARVIKIENARTRGDVTRHWRAPGESRDTRVSAYYASINYRKEVVFLDLKTADAQAEAQALIRSADLVITNFLPATARRLHMDVPTLRALSPTLIVAELSGFGPGEARPAFDVVLQAETGFMYMNGTPDGAPVKMPVALIDVLAAHQLKEGILLALLRRGSTGRGATVRASLLGAALASLVNQATNYLMAGHIPQRMGSEHPNIAPYGDQFRTADGLRLVLAVGSDAQFVALCELLELPRLAEHPSFRTNADRVRHRAALRGALAPAFAQRAATTLLPACHARGIPVGRIRAMDEVMEWPLAQQMLREEQLSDGQLTRRLSSIAFEIEE